MVSPDHSSVFISYVEEDKAIARSLAAALEARGYRTWYYERDCAIGADYFVETFRVISCCDAVLLIISKTTLDKDANSKQITREVVRAAETSKFFLPLLAGGVSNTEVKERQPGWKQAMGAANCVAIPPEGIAAILPMIVGSLKIKGIFPNGAGPQETTQPDNDAEGKTAGKRVVLLYKRNTHPDEEILKFLERELKRNGHHVFIDRHLQPGVEWLLEIQRQVSSADAVVPLLSQASINSEMLEAEVKTAHEAAQHQNGKPYLIPVRINLEGDLPEPLGQILNPIQYTLWQDVQDNQKILQDVCAGLDNPPKRKPRALEPAGGAVPLNSEFYIARPTDKLFAEAIARHDSIVLIKGARQMGKTSLLARGLCEADQAGSKVVFTDFQALDSEDLRSSDAFYRALAASIADQLEMEYVPERDWKSFRSPNSNFQTFLRDALGRLNEQLVWGMDEVDRLLNCSFAGDVFGLFRFWHNSRATDFKGPWKRLTLAIAYATEAHLFISDPNMSPFNVGTRLELADFNFEQVNELNRRYDCPLVSLEEVRRFFRMVGGNPYLVRRGLQEMRTQSITLKKFEAIADRDEGPFGDHLRRILLLLAKDPGLCEMVRRVLQGESSIPEDSFYRLRSGGVMSGGTKHEVGFRCQLYASYLGRNLLAHQLDKVV